jgi:ABC-type branched-subunit amino acid transport system ATPase component
LVWHPRRYKFDEFSVWFLACGSPDYSIAGDKLQQGYTASAEKEKEDELLKVKDLQAGYGFLQIIWGASLNISEGEFVALIGPNGAGKTTIMRTISGILKPKAGEITFQGEQLGGVSTDRINQMGITYITEELNLFTGMTVRENLQLGAFIIKDPKKINKTMESVFELFPILKERQKQAAGTLSGGERKMLGIGRGLMANPKLLLIDEPSLGLAPKLARSVFEALQELNRRGQTILLVEQNVNLSLHITQRVYVLEQGRIVMEGKSADLLESEYIKKVYLGVSAAAD